MKLLIKKRYKVCIEKFEVLPLVSWIESCICQKTIMSLYPCSHCRINKYHKKDRHKIWMFTNHIFVIFERRIIVRHSASYKENKWKWRVAIWQLGKYLEYCAYFGQLAILFLWTLRNLFHVAWKENFLIMDTSSFTRKTYCSCHLGSSFWSTCGGSLYSSLWS